MIEKNLGNAERLLRLVFGVLLGGWLLAQPDTNGIDMFVGAVVVALILNGIFSRCYLWYVLDINTSSEKLPAPDCNSV
ncbi:MAG: DUF2892 domain-containing protein [Halioglobus sp.]